MSRERDLTQAAMLALEAGDDPLGQTFLLDHQVTPAERRALADRLAQAARIYLLLIDDINTDRARGEAALSLVARASAQGLAGAPIKEISARGAAALNQIARDRVSLRPDD